MSRETIMIIFQPGYWRTWTNHISVWHYVASLATDNVNLLLKCYSRSRTSILRIVTSSVFTWICMLSLVCINISHLVSGFCPGQWHCVQPRDSQLLHITFMTFIFFRLYCNIADVENFQQQATVIICNKAQIDCHVCQVSRMDRHRHIIAQAIQASLNLIKLNVFAGKPGEERCGWMTRPVSECSNPTPHAPRHLINLHVTTLIFSSFLCSVER